MHTPSFKKRYLGTQHTLGTGAAQVKSCAGAAPRPRDAEQQKQTCKWGAGRPRTLTHLIAQGASRVCACGRRAFQEPHDIHGGNAE